MNTENHTDPIAQAAAERAANPSAQVEATGQASIALVQHSLTEFDRVAAGLAELNQKYRGVVFAVQTAAGMAEARLARAAIREPRYAVAKAAKDAKAPLNALKKDIDARAEQITEALGTLETPIHQQIEAEETRKANERAAKAAAERERVQTINTRIEAIRSAAVDAAACQSAAEIQAMIDRLQAVELDPSHFEEFAEDAIKAHAETLARMRFLHVRKAEEEAERARLAAEREEAERRLAAERAELERQRAEQAERERLAAEAMAREEAEAEARRAAERAEIERQRQAMVAELELQRQKAEQARLQVEREREAERLAFEAEKAAAAAESARLAAEREEFERQRDEELRRVELEAMAETAETAEADALPPSASADASQVKTYPNGAPMYSTTTFKDNGDPIMLDPDGKRSIFCDVDDDDGVEARPEGAPCPSDLAIVSAVANAFDVDFATALGWLQSIDLNNITA